MKRKWKSMRDGVERAIAAATSSSVFDGQTKRDDSDDESAMAASSYSYMWKLTAELEAFRDSYTRIEKDVVRT
ncbi:hypothetical protein HK102_013587, partial [Quaeritorhiza haematococci]